MGTSAAVIAGMFNTPTRDRFQLFQRGTKILCECAEIRAAAVLQAGTDTHIS